MPAPAGDGITADARRLAKEADPPIAGRKFVTCHAGDVRYTHSVLFSALRQAVRWKLLLTNPAEEVYLPRHSRRRFTVFDVEQARQFIAAISGHRYEVLFALAMTTGMRPSEYLALTWSDFDLERGAVSVSKTLQRRE